jgi:WD40 repeat protein
MVLPLWLAAVSAQGAAPPARPLLDAWGDRLPPGAVARLGTARLRHGGPISDLIFSRDGKRLAALGGDGLRLWDTSSGRHIWADGSPTKLLTAIDLTPDGKAVLAGYWDGTLRLWALDTGRELRVLKGGRWMSVAAVRCSPDGKRVLVGDCAGRIHLWDLPAGRLLRTDRIFPVVGLVQEFTPDGRLAVVPGQNGKLLLWDVERAKAGLLLQGDKQGVSNPIFSPDGRFLAASEWGGSLRVWELSTGRPLWSRPGRDTAMVFTRDGRTLISAGARGAVRLRDPATGKERRRLRAGGGKLAVSRDGRQLAVGRGDGLMRLWDLRTGKERVVLAGHRGGARPLGFLPGGRTLLVCSGRGTHFWHVGKPPRPGATRPVRELRRLPDLKGVMALSPDGKLLVSPGKRDYLLLSKTSDGSRVGEFGPVLGFPTPMPAFSADGRSVFFIDREKVAVHSISRDKTEELVGSIPAVALALSPDGKTLATLDRKGDAWQVLLWDVRKGEAVDRIPLTLGEREQVDQPRLVFCPKGRTLALGDYYARLRLWDARAGWRVLGRTGPFAFSPDGKTVATTSGWLERPCVRLYAVSTGRLLRELRGHRGRIIGLAFSPDGKTLATGSADNTVLLWEL